MMTVSKFVRLFFFLALFLGGGSSYSTNTITTTSTWQKERKGLKMYRTRLLALVSLLLS